MISRRFPKNRHLNDAKAFSSVFQTPTTRVTQPSLLLLARPNTLGYARLGLAISKRHVKLATRRNQAKRVIREAFRNMQATLPAVDVVVLSRMSLQQCPKENLWIQLNAMWPTLITV